MITVEEQQLREHLAIEEITFAIPAQSFAIACSISAEEALPVVTEFALRIAYVCGTLSSAQIQDFFGFSKKETDAVIEALLGERLIQWSEDQLELTPYALARFQDSSDNLPRFFKIQDWSAEVVFDLISFSPAGRPNRLRRVRSQVELATRNFDKQSRSIQFAEQSFQQNFRQICKKDKAEIYKISAVDAGERFSIPLPCVFHLDLDGQASVRRDIDDESFGSRLEISEAITDALANQERGNNESLRDFIRSFDDALLGRYVSGDAFDLRRYAQDVHLSKAAAYDDARVTPLLGALHLQRNASRLLERIGDELARLEWAIPDEEGSDRVAGVHESEAGAAAIPEFPHRDGVWWAPQLTLWARSRGARDLVQKLDQLLEPEAKSAVSAQKNGMRVVVPGDRRSSRERLSVYWDQFPRLLGADVSLMNGNLELLLVPGLLVCAMFHFHLAHQPIAIPIGFMSSHPDHLRVASALLSGKVRAKPGSLVAVRDEGGAEAIQDLLSLLERMSAWAAAASPTRDGRPRLALKKSP
ncbi:hypothetical protein BH10PSE16_BH10PSE16_04560 [soil metagenome]